MKNLTLLLLTFFIIAPAYGQVTREVPPSIQRLQDWASEPRILAENTRANIEGSPFYNEDWLTGHVIIKDGTKSTTVKLKYNAYKNDLWFQEERKVMAIPAERLQGFVLIKDNKEIEFRNGFGVEEHDISSQQFMRVIYDGEVKLLAHEYNPMNKDKDPFSGKMEYTFFSKTDYFLLIPDGEYHKIKLKKRDILKALERSKSKLQKFAESNNLDYDKEKDLKKILALYDKIHKDEGLK